MSTRLISTAAVTIMTAGMLAGSASSASASHDHLAAEPWEPYTDSATIVDYDTVRLVRSEEDTEGTAVQTTNLDFPYQAGQEISFSMDLENGAVCTAGSPRVFVEIDGDFYNSYDFDNSTNCAEGEPPASTQDGTVTFSIPVNGRIGAAGVVYDDVTQPPGAFVEISDLRIAGHLMLFEARPEVVRLTTHGDVGEAAAFCQKAKIVMRVDNIQEGQVADPSFARFRVERNDGNVVSRVRLEAGERAIVKQTITRAEESAVFRVFSRGKLLDKARIFNRC